MVIERHVHGVSRHIHGIHSHPAVLEGSCRIKVVHRAFQYVERLERYACLLVFLAEEDPVASFTQSFHFLHDSTVREIRVTLKYILMIEHQLIEHCATLHIDAVAND